MSCACVCVKVFVSGFDWPDDETNFAKTCHPLWKVESLLPAAVQPKHLLIHMGEQNDVVQLHLHTQVILLGLPDGSHCAEGTQSLVNH